MPASLTHSLETFEGHLQALTGLCPIVDFDTIAAFLAGEADLPPACVAITFDDGFVDNLDLAVPLLEKYGVPATFYVTADYVVDGGIPWFLRTLRAFQSTSRESWTPPDKAAVYLDSEEQRDTARRIANRFCAATDSQRRLQFLADLEESLGVSPASDAEQPQIIMNAEQLRRLTQKGFTVGSHSTSHPNLALLPLDVAQNEVEASKQVLEEIISAPVRHFAYPNPILQPHFTEATMQLLQAAGYHTGATSVSGTADTRTPQFALPRLSAPDDPDDLLWRISAALIRDSWKRPAR